MGAKVYDNGRTIGLEDEMQHGRDVLSRAWRLLHHLSGNSDESREKFLNDGWQRIIFLAESESPNGFQSSDTSSVNVTDFAADEKLLDLANKCRPLRREVVGDDRFEGICQLEGDALCR